MKHRVVITKDLEEVKEHGNLSFPLEIASSKLSLYEDASIACHWHKEIEFLYCLKGTMEYQVNEKSYVVHPQEAVFVNANNLHAARLEKEEDCTWFAIVFDPVLLYGHENSILYQKYVGPVVNKKEISSCFLHHAKEEQKRILEGLLRIHTLYQEKEELYEMRIQNELTAIWMLLYEQLKEEISQVEIERGPQMERLKAILSYIHEHYASEILLADIAKTCGISRGECCKLFKAELKQTIFEYILRYRIEKSIPLLLKGEDTITQIAYQTGFASSSYYAHIFKRITGKTPKQIRTQS
ncbi:MAG: AraC family transcriptional regulator [Lachnospiraceae bacterium]|nr:AraC family transcriptional regulator [Lachnospiraceae bacterium]